MEKVFNKTIEPWERPWNIKQFDDLYNRDERFFAIIVKGLISWLNRNIVMYNESINHFIFNTGSSYLYMESNGYEYNLSETTGEDSVYMKLPRCIMEISDISFPMEELTSPYSRGHYERRTGNLLSGFSAEIRRLPIELTINLKYYLSNFNETIILLQELIDKLIFQKYFNITYLGQIIQCSIEFPGNVAPQINKIDMSSPDPNQRNITMDIKICTNYPLINERTEMANDKIIVAYGTDMELKNNNYTSDEIERGSIMNNNLDNYNEFVNSVTNNEYIDYNNLDNLQELIDKYDSNNDGLLDEFDIEKILNTIKYSNGDIDDYLNYNTLTNVINIINSKGDMNITYDNFNKSLYVYYNESGDTKEIKLEKYKIQNNE